MNSNEQKREFLFRKQNGRTNLPKYIEELNNLLDTAKGNYQLLNLKNTDKVLQRAYQINNPKKTFQLKFYEKDKFLQECFTKCSKKPPDKAYFYIDFSKDCGITFIDSLLMIKTDFSFSSEHAGIIVIISEDLNNKIVLDYYEENEDSIIEIELCGEEWSKVKVKYQ